MLAEEMLPLLADAFPQCDWTQARLSPHPIQGYKSRIFDIDMGLDRSLIAKLRPAGEDRPPFARELDLLTWLQSRGMACASPRGLGRVRLRQNLYHILLLERAEGQPLAESEGFEGYCALGRYLNRLNRLQPPYPQGLTLMEANGIRQWTQHSIQTLAALNFFTEPEIRTLNQRLRPVWQPQLENAMQKSCLIHNDPNALNVMMLPQGEISAVLDWESSLLGPPEYQMATVMAYAAYPGLPINPDQIRQRQHQFLRGYGQPGDELVSALQLVRLLGTLSQYCTPESFQPGAYAGAYSPLPPESREQYEQKVLWQCEAALRGLLGEMTK